MSSDLFVFDDSFFNDPFSSNFNIDSPIDENILQAIHNYNNPIHENSSNPGDGIETNSLDQISPAIILCSSCPPSSQLEKLSLSQTTENSSNSSSLDVKTEEFQFPFHSSFDFKKNCLPYSCGGTESTAKMMQRSFSSHSFDGNPTFMLQPQFGNLMVSPNFNTLVLSSPENSPFTGGQLRKPCSTGDLHNMRTSQRLSSSPLDTERSFTMEETNSKLEPYNAEERKQRIHRYRAKRNHRNFNKTIKYACRKTLAEGRARIRGRFARNGDTAQIPQAATLNPFQDHGHYPWMEGFCEGYDRATVGRAPLLLNTYSASQLHFCGY